MAHTRKYSDEELIDKAKGYSDYQTLHKENRALYDTIHRRGLEEKAYAHFDTWGRKRWSIESALVAAQECNMILKVFRKRYSGAYWSCRENGWLDIIFPNRRKNKKSYSIKDFRSSLKQAKSLKLWRKKHSYLSTVAFQHGWFVSEDERLTKLAEKNGLDTLDNQYARNILSNFSIITEENIKRKAKMCSERSIFKKYFPQHYQKARSLKILDEACLHMPIPRSKEFRAIYAAEFADGSVYVGLSYDVEHRWTEHMKNENSAVYKHSKEYSIDPVFKMIHPYEPKEIAKVLEGEYKDRYKKDGWKILNRAKTGSLGASERRLSENYILKVASTCESYKSFREDYGGVYHTALRLGMLYKIKQLIEPQLKITKWIDHPDIIEELALKCKSHLEFRSKHEAASQAAVKLGIYDKITRHMPPKRIAKMTKEDVYMRIQERKYKTYTDFTQDGGTYNAAKRLKMIDEIKKILPEKEKEPYYSIEYLHSITKRYNSFSEFDKEHHNLYEYIRSHKLKELLFSHFIREEKRIMSEEFVLDECKKYKNATEVALNDRTIYNYLRKNRLLDKAFPDRRKVGK